MGVHADRCKPCCEACYTNGGAEINEARTQDLPAIAAAVAATRAAKASESAAAAGEWVGDAYATGVCPLPGCICMGQTPEAIDAGATSGSHNVGQLLLLPQALAAVGLS
jgi:hypothetical protein